MSTVDANKNRKPKSYDESDVPNVLRAPVSLSKDYDVPREPIMDGTGPHGRGMGPGKGTGPCSDPVKAILVCPDCDTEAPFNLVPPPGVPVGRRVLCCASCGSDIKFPKLSRSASDGKYRIV